MGLKNIISNEFIFDNWLYDFYIDHFIEEYFQDIETDLTVKTYKENLQAQSTNNARGTNSLVYSLGINKMSKRSIVASCSEADGVSTQDCAFTTICASIPLPRIVLNQRVGFISIPEDNVYMYARFLKFIENNTDEGRWPKPAKDADGNIKWIVEYIAPDGSIRTKTHNVEAQDLVVDETNENGNIISITYKPRWRLSNAEKVNDRVKVKDLNKDFRQEWAPEFEVDSNGQPTRQFAYRWYVHYDSTGLSTLGFGHLIDDDQKDNRKITLGSTLFKSNWDDTYGEGLTDAEIIELFGKDINRKIRVIQNIIGAKRWNYLAENCPQGIISLIEVGYNTKSGIAGYPSMCAAMGIPQDRVKDPKTGKIVWSGTWSSDFTPEKDFKPNLAEIAKQLQRSGTGNRDEMVRQIFILQNPTTFRTLGGTIRKDIVPDAEGSYLKKTK